MMFWLEIVGTWMAIAVLATVIGLYVRYRRSPEGKWRAHVERWLAAAEKQLRAARRERKSAAAALQKEEEAIRRRALDAFIKSLSLTELEAYPGIGPGTLSKLQGAGFTNVSMLQDARIHVPGLGSKRLADIANAVSDVVRQAKYRFQAGACREAQELDAQLKAVRARRARRASLVSARLAGAEEVMSQMRPLLEHARKVSFFRSLRCGSKAAFADGLLPSALPDLEQAMRAAEARATALASRRLPAVNGQTEPGSVDGLASPSAAAAMPNRSPASAAEPPAAVLAAPPELFQEALRSPTPALPPRSAAPRELLDLARLEAIVVFAFAVARADGRIARKEKEIIEQYVQSRFGNDQALLNRARVFCAQYESAAIDLACCLDQLTNLFTTEEQGALFHFAGEIADATGPRNQREIEFLEKIAGQLGIAPALPQAEPANPLTDKGSPVPIGESKPAIPATPEEMLGLLEIDPRTPLSADLVRRQFHLLSERYAPDKFASMGQEFVSVAEHKRAALLAAATTLLERWGQKLQTHPPPGQPAELRRNPDLDAMFGA